MYASAALVVAAGFGAAPECTLFSVKASGPQLDGPPATATDAELETWWKQMQDCRTAQLAVYNYSGKAFKDAALEWTQGAFAIPMVQGYDRFLYDPATGEYTVDRYLEDVQSRYGGVDAIFLWPTYTNIGMDDRNQLDLFRAMPGGLSAIRNLTSDFHKRGVKVMWGYNPWDTGTRREAGWANVSVSDPIDITTTAAEGGADGFNMDTMGSTPFNFRQAALAIGHDMAYQPEGGGKLFSMDWETMSTCHCNYNRLEQTVDHYKFLDSRRMTSVRDRWSPDHTDSFHQSFFNGVGFESTENDWGTNVPFSPQNGEALRRINAVMRYLNKASGGLLKSPSWRPHVPGVLHRADGVFASHFPSPTLPSEEAWLFVNRNKDEGYSGPQFKLPSGKGGLWDCWRGEALTPGSDGTVSFEIEAGGYGCLLRTTNSTNGPLGTFVEVMQKLTGSGPLSAFDATYHDLQQTITPTPRTTPLFSPPKGMVAVPGAPLDEGYRFTVSTVKTQGRGSQFGWEANLAVKHGATIPVRPFYIDRYPVTCGEWEAFVNASGYSPKDSTNYLKNWDWSKGGNRPVLPPALASNPVVYVSLAEARRYCAAAGKRLPQDWEWQYAGQAGKDGRVDGRKYPWGNTCAAGKKCEPPAMTQETIPGTSPVGAYSPQGDSQSGVGDMTGNVWQYTTEVMDAHSRGALVRGGSNYRPGIKGVAGSRWYFTETDASPLSLHNKYMLMSDSYERAGTLGFRCVADAPDPAECTGVQVCGRWSGPPAGNTTLKVGGDTVEWARWRVNGSGLEAVRSRGGTRRIGSPRAACTPVAGQSGVAMFSWEGGVDEGGKEVGAARNTTDAAQFACGFELDITSSGHGTETLALYAGVGEAAQHVVNVTAFVSGTSNGLSRVLRGVQPTVTVAGGGGSQADALFHVSYEAAQGAVLTVRWEVVSNTPGPPPSPPAPAADSYTEHKDVVCGTARGAAQSAGSVKECEAACSKDTGCSCAQWDAAAGTCQLRSVCQVGKCKPQAGALAVVRDYHLHAGVNCYGGHGAKSLDNNVPLTNVSVQECLDYCEGNPKCSAAQYKVADTDTAGTTPARSCWRRADVDLAKCSHQNTQDIYLRPTTFAPDFGGSLLYAAALLAGSAPPLSGY